MTKVKTHTKKRDGGAGTLAFTATFILAILLFAVLLIWGFLTVSDTIDTGETETWSSLADFITATLGVAVALAGSVVAIYIAHRAYSISRKQAFMEERAIVERTVDNTVETLWQLTGSIRNLFDGVDEIVLAALSNGTIHGWGDQDPRSEKELARYMQAAGAFQRAVEDVRLATLRMVRDPIARSAFQLASKRFTEDIATATAAAGSEVSRAWADILAAEGDADVLAALLRSDGAMAGVSPSLPARIVFTQIGLKAWKTEDGVNYTRKERRREHDGGYKIVEVTKSLSEIEDGRELVGADLRRKLTVPEVKLLLTGAYMRIERLSGGKPEQWSNLGAVALTAVIGSFPRREDLLAAHDALLLDNMGFGEDVLEHSRKYLLLSGIDSFMAKSIGRGAEAIRTSPRTVIMLRGADD